MTHVTFFKLTAFVSGVTVERSKVERGLDNVADHFDRPFIREIVEQDNESQQGLAKFASGASAILQKWRNKIIRRMSIVE